MFGIKKKKSQSQLATNFSRDLLQSDTLINAIADGVIVTDNEGIIMLCNPAAANITGWKAEDAGGLDVHSVLQLLDTKSTTEAELPRSEYPIDKVITLGQSSVSDDAMLKTADSRKVILSMLVSPIMNQKDERSGTIAIFRDVSAQRAQEQQRAEFISTASHEMRTPVAAIEGYLALALNDKVSKIDSKARTYLEKAHESTQHLGTLFRDLLTAAKSEDGRLVNHPEVVEMTSFLMRLVEDSKFTAEKQGLQLEFGVAGDGKNTNVVQPIYYAHVDPERIREAITNLINNAIKFTQSGGVLVGIRGDENIIQISVKDTGMGIPENDVNHLFEKFYRVDNSATRTIGGTGLGLYITRSIVEQLYQGQIWVESTVGEGSTFYINLPRLSLDQAEQLQKQAEFNTVASPKTTAKNGKPAEATANPAEQATVVGATSVAPQKNSQVQ